MRQIVVVTVLAAVHVTAGAFSFSTAPARAATVQPVEVVAEPGVVPRTVPSAPTSLVATPANTAARLTWTAPGHGGAAITDYVVQRSPNGTTGWTTVADGISTAPSATVSGLANGTRVYFRVAARNAAGTGATSPVVNAVSRPVPSAPASVRATAGPRSVRVTWTAPANGGAAITDYVVQRSAIGTWITVVDGVSTTPAAMVSNLTTGTRVYIRVAAKNAAGTGAQ